MKKKLGTVGIKVGNIIDEVGERRLWDNYFQCIKTAFPEVDTNKQFPLIIMQLYLRGIKRRNAEKALVEMNMIATRLKEITTSEGITYFNLYQSSTGRNITLLILECIQASVNEKKDIETLSYDTVADIAFR